VWTRRYLRNFELKKKEWPHIESYFSREVRDEIATLPCTAAGIATQQR
jgi:hypothetical protein